MSDSMNAVVRWVSVSDQMPEKDHFVLLANRTGEVVPGTFSAFWKRWEEYGFDQGGDPVTVEDVTHWAAFPDAPNDGIAGGEVAPWKH